MDFKLYNFDKVIKTSENESKGFTYKVTDYWQYYTTGVESLVNSKEFFKTDRRENEKTEVLTWKFYNSPDTADIVLASNNDVFLWDTPFDFSYGEKIKDNKMNYFKKIYKKDLSDTDDVYLYYNNIFIKDVADMNEQQSTVVLPKMGYLQQVIRKFQDYFRQRTVK